MSKQGRILVIRGGAIGDFILTTPALRALREQFPNTHIELLGYPHIAELARAGSLVDEVRSIEARALALFFARGAKLPADLADYFSSFAVIVSYLYDPDLIFQTNVRAVSKAQFIIGPHRPNEGETQHATEVFLAPLQKLAIFGADPIPRLAVGSVETPSRPLLAIHPGSGSESKNWPLEQWLTLVEKVLVESQLDIAVVGGEADAEKLRAFEPYLDTPRVKTLHGLPLTHLAQALRQATAFIGHDSGITHLAAALGLPVLALWGPSNSRIWSPTGPRVRIVRNKVGPISALTVREVWEELQPLVAA